MALLWADGFDTYGTTPNGGRDAMLAGAYVDVRGGNHHLYGPMIRETNPRTGTSSLWIAKDSYNGNNNRWVRRVTLPQDNVLGVGVSWYLVTLPDNQYTVGYAYFDISGNPILSFYIAPDGSIYVTQGRYDAPIILVTDAGVITASAYNHIETKIVFDSVVGSIEIRVNGITVVRADDLALTNEPATSVAFGTLPRSTVVLAAAEMYIDDIICWDGTGDTNNDFFGPARVMTLFPEQDTDVSGFSVVGAATGHEAVNNVPPDGDTTYISGAAVGARSEFKLEELPPEVEAIAGVYIPLMGKLSSAGEGNVQPSIVSNDVASLGEDIPLTTAYTYWGSVIEKNEDTGAPWSREDFNNAVIRVEKTL